MFCQLGKKKHLICEKITGIKYKYCITNKSHPHFVASCYRVDPGSIINQMGGVYDIVNYKTGDFVLIGR